MEYLGRSLRKAAQVAGRIARYALFLGPDELARGEATLKDLSSGEARPLSLADLAAPERLLPLLSPRTSQATTEPAENTEGS